MELVVLQAEKARRLLPLVSRIFEYYYEIAMRLRFSAVGY